MLSGRGGRNATTAQNTIRQRIPAGRRRLHGNGEHLAVGLEMLDDADAGR